MQRGRSRARIIQCHSLDELLHIKKREGRTKDLRIVAGRREEGRERGKDMVCSCSFNKDLWGNVV